MDRIIYARQAFKLVNQKVLNLLLAATLLMGFSADLLAAKKKKKKKKQELAATHAGRSPVDANLSPVQKIVLKRLLSDLGDMNNQKPETDPGASVLEWETLSQEELNADLRDMVAAGCHQEAHDLLKDGANARYVGDDGVSLIQLAQGNQDEKMVYLLMEYGASIDDPQTAFHFQVEQGATDKVATLIASGTVNIDDANAQGKTALIQAAQAGDVTMVELLLDKGARAQEVIAEWPYTAFRAAYENGHMDVVCIMLDHDILPCEHRVNGEHRVNDFSFTWEALFNEYKENKELPFFELLSACAQRHFMDDTHVFAEDFKQQLEYLQDSCDWSVSRGVDAHAASAAQDDGQENEKIGQDRQAMAFNMIDNDDCLGLAENFMQPGSLELLGFIKDGKTPLEYAVAHNKPTIVAKLLEYYNVQDRAKKSFYTHILSAFMSAAKIDSQEMIGLFLGDDPVIACDIDYQDPQTRNTIVMEAINKGSEKVLDYLLQCNPAPNLHIRNGENETAFLCAVKSGSIDMAEKLLKAKRDNIHLSGSEVEECLDAESKGAWHSKIGAVIAHKKDMANVSDTDGNTPLIIAAGKGYDKMIDFLLRIGISTYPDLNPVNIGQKNRQGETAIDVATNHKIKGILAIATLNNNVIAATNIVKGTRAAMTKVVQQKNSSPKVSAPGMYKCLGCSELKEKKLSCARCKKIVYCSRECQKIDWKRHKPECVSKNRSAVSESAASVACTQLESTFDAQPDFNADSPANRQIENTGTPSRVDDGHLALLRIAQQKREEERVREKEKNSERLVVALNKVVLGNKKTYNDVRYCREKSYELYGQDNTPENRKLLKAVENTLFPSDEKRPHGRVSPAGLSYEKKQTSQELTRAAIKKAKAATHNSKSSSKSRGHAPQSGAKNKSSQFRSGPPVQLGYARRDVTLPGVPLAASWRGELPVFQDNQADQAAMLFAGTSGSSAFSAVSSAAGSGAAARAVDYDEAAAGEQYSGAAQIAEDVFDAPGSEQVRFVPGEDADFVLDYEQDLEKLDNGQHIIGYHQPLFPDGISEVHDGGEQYGQYAQEQLASRAAEHKQGAGYKKIWSGYDWLWVNMRHIMYGDKHGGGHLHNEDKTCFPRWLEPRFEQRLERAFQNLDYEGQDAEKRFYVLGTFEPEQAGEVPVRFKGRFTQIRGYVVADPETGEETLIEDKNGDQRISILGTVYPIYDREYDALTGL